MVWGPPLVYWDSKGTQDLTEHAKTIGFSRGTGEPLDNRGTGGPPFRSVSSLMLSTSWTGDQLLVKGTQLWNDWPIESLGQVILVAFTTWITCKMHFTWRSVVQKDSTSLPLMTVCTCTGCHFRHGKQSQTESWRVAVNDDIQVSRKVSRAKIGPVKRSERGRSL